MKEETNMSFANKTVLITGGASGIGLLSGQCYAREGANVVLVDINREALDACVAQIREYQPNVLGVCIDIRQYDKVEEACKQAYEAFPIEVYDFGIDVNLKGALYFDHAVMKYMAEQKSGVIIHLGSITGAEGCATNVAYSASKSALMNGMTLSLAQYGARYNLRCMCVAPGPVLTRPAMANMKTLLGRAAQTQEIVDMILYVTSDKGAFMTGSTILIDGGRYAMARKG